MAQLGNQAAFLSAGGYHHHLGGEHLGERGRLPRAARDSAALRHATIVLPDAAERDRLVARLETAGHPVSRRRLRIRPRVDPSGQPRSSSSTRLIASASR